MTISADPTTLGTEYDRAVSDHHDRLGDIEAQLESERPGVASAWDNASRTEQVSALDLLRGDFSAEIRGKLSDLKAQLDRQKVSSARLSATIRDLVLAAHHSLQGGGIFTDLVNERAHVDDQLAYALDGQAARRGQLRDDWMARRDTARAGLAEAEDNLRNAKQHLSRLARRPEISYESSRHMPYTY